jgi:predicted  nucleic acid-binding Zn-ribbon protein
MKNNVKDYIRKGNKVFNDLQELRKKLDSCEDETQRIKLENEIKRLQKEFNRIFDIVFK